MKQSWRVLALALVALILLPSATSATPTGPPDPPNQSDAATPLDSPLQQEAAPVLLPTFCQLCPQDQLCVMKWMWVDGERVWVVSHTTPPPAGWSHLGCVSFEDERSGYGTGLEMRLFGPPPPQL